MRLSLAAFCLSVVGCSDRPPPPGAGALETTPTGREAAAQAPVLPSTPKILAYPNGSIVMTDPKTCRIALVRDGTPRWDHELAGCGGLLEATLTMDSMLYVRDLKNLSSFDPEGALRWAVRLTDAPPQNPLAAPAELADSRVALATTAKNVLVYDRDGSVSWAFSPQSDEVLAAAPVGMKTEGLILITTRAAYYLSAAGEVRWRVARKH